MIDILFYYKDGQCPWKIWIRQCIFFSVHVSRIRPGTCYQMQHPVVNENKLGL